MVESKETKGRKGQRTGGMKKSRFGVAMGGKVEWGEDVVKGDKGDEEE